MDTRKENGKKSKARLTQAVREAKLKHKWLLERIAEETADTQREFARGQVARELAAWIMALRAKFDVMLAEVQEVFFECRKEGRLLHGLLDTDRLGRIFSDLQSIDGDLPLLTVNCESYGPIKVADNWEKGRDAGAPAPEAADQKGGA